MPDKNVSSPQEQNLNAKNPSLSNNVIQGLRLTIPLATVALCVLNSHRPVFATNLNSKTPINEDIQWQKSQHFNHSFGWRSRIVSLFTSVFKISPTTNLFEADDDQPESQAISSLNGMGGSLVQDFAPTYLSQAQSASTEEFLVKTKINSLLIAKNSPTLTNQDELKTYTVKTGDTIYQIAARLQVNRQELIALNKINNSNIIFVDQKLKLPATNLAQEQPEKTTAFDNGSVTLTSINFPQNNLKQTIPLSTSPNYLAAKGGQAQALPLQGRERLTDIQPKSEDRSQLRMATNKTTVTLPGDRLTKLRAKKVDAVSSIKPKNSQDSDSILQKAIALKLPPLPSLEEYLPEAFDGKYAWPAQGVLSSGYGWRWGRLHQGIDIAAPVGTPVLAAAAGEVVSAGWTSGGYGNLIEIQHPDGSMTVYGHNDQILVSSGQQVSQGEQIAAMGNTGFSTGPHLHFEIHLADQGIVDPLALLN